MTRDNKKSGREIIEAVADELTAAEIAIDLISGKISAEEALLQTPISQKSRTKKDVEMVNFFKNMPGKNER